MEGDEPRYAGAERAVRLALTAALAVWVGRYLLAPAEGSFLDGVDLAIHEAGHLVFAFGGETLMLAGGTLLQLLFPAAFAVELLRRGDPHGSTVALGWLAQSLGNVSVYARDARAQALPLVGGGEHDWALLLGKAGLLDHDQAVGAAFHALAVVVHAAAVAGGLAFATGRGERLLERFPVGSARRLL